MKKVLIHTVFLCACSLGFLKTQARDDIYSSAMINWSNPTLMCSVPAPPVNIVSGFSFLGYRTKTLDAYVKCWLNTNNIPPGMGTFSATIDITIKYYLEDPNSNSTQSPVTVNRMLTLDYNAAAGVSYKNVAIENFPNAAKIEIIAVNSFLVNGSAPSAAQKQFISLQLFIKHERYYNYNNIFGGIPMLTLLPNPVPNYDALNNELEISWVPEAFAEGYELQYSFVDDYGNTGWNNNFVPASQLNFSFRNNCTRILLQQTSYKIPLVFEHGWVVWRVRGYSYGGANLDKLFYGPFNATVDGNQIFTVQSYPHKFPVTGNNIVHTNDKISWQSVTSFAEEGKSKTVVKYMDGNWRNRQTVTSASTERNAIVGEDIYDFQGRSAVNILPAPVENAAIKYYKNFNRNLSDLPYTAIDFDTKGPGECDPFAIGPLLQVTGATNNTGAGNYYSKHNPDQSLFNAWIPDADGYALARVTFMPDATNRVVRQGNAGELFQPGKTASGITQSHDTRYYYGKPVQVKLDQLFGTNVGYAQFYQKNLVVDPNGQVSVSYVDLDGKTVATALAGTSPASLEPLGSNPQMPLMVDLLSDADMVDSVSHSIKMSQSILVSANNTPYNFKYKITANTYNALSCQSKNYCLDCIYDLKITLVNDECGRIEYYDSSTVGTLANLDLLCNDPAPNKQVNFTAMLNVGSYTITKELIVNKQAAETYAERIVNDSANTCLKTYNDFYNEAWNNRDTTRCMEACDACIAESANAISTTAVAAAVKACDSLWCKPRLLHFATSRG